MQKTKLFKFGWLAAAALAISVGIVGFAQNQPKFGVVDLNRVIQESELGKKNQAKLKAALDARKELIDFVTTYQVLTGEQAQRLRELMLKDAPSEAEKGELAKIKSDVQASDRRRQELVQKTNPTDADLAILQDFNNRRQIMQRTLERWQMEFNDELDGLQQRVRDETIAKAKVAVKDVCAADGYSLVLESTVAPFGSNDVTDSCIKKMNASP